MVRAFKTGIWEVGGSNPRGSIDNVTRRCQGRRKSRGDSILGSGSKQKRTIVPNCRSSSVKEEKSNLDLGFLIQIVYVVLSRLKRGLVNSELHGRVGSVRVTWSVRRIPAQQSSVADIIVGTELCWIDPVAAKPKKHQASRLFVLGCSEAHQIASFKAGMGRVRVTSSVRRIPVQQSSVADISNDASDNQTSFGSCEASVHFSV
ncbi:hypothetical protein MRB53_033148 [Persea americana]|uniref:Uncharacterized protein n=1 Tax=Persea americana TaxID=3435 RepID=A0ACC2KU31_PERAE|nr:hypothetical protein MRB53_033148 [Persea americana]